MFGINVSCPRSSPGLLDTWRCLPVLTMQGSTSMFLRQLWKGRCPPPLIWAGLSLCLWKGSEGSCALAPGLSKKIGEIRAHCINSMTLNQDLMHEFHNKPFVSTYYGPRTLLDEGYVKVTKTLLLRRSDRQEHTYMRRRRCHRNTVGTLREFKKALKRR